MPERGAVWGLPVALSLTLSVAARLPVAKAVKVTLMLPATPGTSVAPQSVVRAKSAGLEPEMEILLMLSVAAPALLSVVVNGELLVLTFRVPKLKLVGFNAAMGAAVKVTLACVRVTPSLTSVAV
jgi:hypothetical protein